MQQLYNFVDKIKSPRIAIHLHRDSSSHPISDQKNYVKITSDPFHIENKAGYPSYHIICITFFTLPCKDL